MCFVCLSLCDSGLEVLRYGGAARGRRGVGVPEGQVFGEGARGTGSWGGGGEMVEDINRGRG